MRVNKASIAKYLDHTIKHNLCWFNAEEIINRLFYEFASLHGIGVYPDRENNSDRLVYYFVGSTVQRYRESNLYEKPEIDKCNIGLNLNDVSHLDEVRNSLWVIMNVVEKHFNLPHWEDYLDEKPKDGLDVTMCRCVTQEELEKSHDELKKQIQISLNSIYGVPKKHDDRPDTMYYLASRGFGKTNWAAQQALAYCENDVKATRELYDQFRLRAPKRPDITIAEVIFHDPATIVIWRDGTKTVVKAQDGEMYDPEKGLAMAICKKVMGNTRDYYNVFLKYLKQWKKENPEKEEAIEAVEIYERLYNFVTLHELMMTCYTADDPDYRHCNDYEITDGHTTMTLTKIPVRGTIQELNKIEKAIYEFFKL